MSDPITGLPAQAGPSSDAVQPAPGATQDQTQSAAAASNPSQELERLQAELATERTRSQNLDNLNRTVQARNDQVTNQLRAVTGATPQVDPLADDINYFTKGGLNPDDAKLVAGFVHQKVSKLEQQYQQQAQAMQASSQVQSVYDTAARQNPQLFADQNYARAAWNALQQAAINQPQYVTPEYAEAVAKQEWADAYWKSQQPNAPLQTQQFQPAPIQHQNIPSFNGPSGGFTPALANQPKAVSPLVAKFNEDIKARFGTK